MRPALHTSQLDVVYGHVRALQGVSIDVVTGSITALVGANGAGKSTLLKAVAGLVPIRRGRVEAPLGVNITRMPAHERVRKLGLVLIPEGRGVFGSMRVEENLLMGIRIGRLRDATFDPGQRLQEIFQLFPILEPRRKQPAGLLSGGEQQMLMIARSLLMEPSVLLVDEPSMGLAPVVVRSLFQALSGVLKTKGITVLLVEQDTKLALSIAEYAYVIRRGQIEVQGRADDIAADPRLLEVYLGS